ncbi:MFS transporter [Cryobacterium melibiosiphilum]|uniref:MFS transporter n=1 Tax=Cryobacterium melibiosiphilum TaxID=995039 RepID=A0A3A5ME42_9MICO|nr:MFS transporter [Cryobacterium melibiosiphilum]RJT87395.1 MFS transporter [Cryobacterium melibiosiphilum]
MTDAAFPPRGLWAGRLLALLGIVLAAGSLRTAVAALSPIVSLVEVDIPLGAVALGLLGMLPPLCFALFGIVTPMFTRRLSLERVLVLALIALAIGHVGRGGAGSFGWFIMTSVVTFAGLGVANVLLPPLVKKYFPDRIGLVTSLYVTVVSLSALVPPLVAVPIADAAGWRVSLGLWGVLTLFALVPWVMMIVRDRRAPVDRHVEEADATLLRRIWGSPIAWAIAVIFGASSLNAYAMFAWLPQLLIDSAGVSPTQAGIMLSLYAAMGFPCAVIIPVLTARLKNVAVLVYLGVFFFIAGDLGLLLLPGTLTWLWVSFAGLGPLFFPLALVLINLRTRTHEGAVALSGFVQSVGYLIGALGPLATALLHEMTGGWTWPLLFLLATAVLVTIAGAVINRPHMLEDDLARP